VAAQPFNISMRHPAPRAVDDSISEFWLENPFDFERLAGFNLSMYERNRVYSNLGGGAFVDTSHLSGIDKDSDSRAVAIGDINEDGRPDLLLRNAGGGALFVFTNAIQGNRSLLVTLRGTKSNRDGIGARLVLEVEGRRLVREHFPANSVHALSANETVFGVGRATGPFPLTITWPSGTVQTLTLGPGRHVIVESD